MKTIVLLQASKEFAEEAAEATKKVEGIFNFETKCARADNSSQAAGYIEMGQAAIIFCASSLTKENLHVFKDALSRARRKPFVIACEETANALEGAIPVQFLCGVTKKFDKDLVFTCIRNLLLPPHQKIDPRYMRSILTSVVSVIQQNTGMKLEPLKIEGETSKNGPLDFSSVVAFYGDGCLGSLRVGAAHALVRSFAKSMLQCSDEDLKEDLLLDLLMELSNQILGGVRNELSEFGYELQSSMQFIAAGDSHQIAVTPVGSEFRFPFRSEDSEFSVTFSYNTYQTTLQEISDDAFKNPKQILDVRLDAAMVAAVQEVFNKVLGEEIALKGVGPHSGAMQKSMSVSLFHACGLQGGLLIALALPQSTAQAIIHRLKGLEAAVSNEAYNDLGNDLVNQLGSAVMAASLPWGYHFSKIFQGNLAATTDVTYLLKNAGKYITYQFQAAGHPLTVCFGTASQYAGEFYDVFDFYKDLAQESKSQHLKA